jgi:hypothetical protein
MTASYGLTCDQQLKVEPLLHDEESVSRPLLRFASFSPEQQQAAMTTIKLAARREIRSLLVPEQQSLLDQEMNLAKAGAGRGRRGSAAGDPTSKPAGLDDEEALSRAVARYAALTPAEKRALLIAIKQAARADSARELSEEQRRKLDSELAELRKN